MSHEAKIHEAQTKILRELLFLPNANFAALQKVTDLESDHAKFHIKRLVELEYLSHKNGAYSLSIKGKEYANKLDTDTNTIERQPKSACAMMLYDKKTKKYLIQKRLKNPYFGFLGFFSGKIRWGEPIIETAVRETKEETNFDTKSEDWEHRGILHDIIRDSKTGEIIEDKIFHMMYTDKFSGELVDKFEGGENFWMTLDEVRQNPKHYKDLEYVALATRGNIGFVELQQEYSEEEF